ncbi:MAG: hypothetical protein JWP85_1274 [Rhodoglobus sp.]|nr:hypothetical protein [Rhodoglobus sp.]
MIADAIARLTVDGTIDTSVDPRAVDQVGTALAQVLDAYSVGALVCWDGNDESALAQVVGADLGVPVIRAEESLGLLTLNHGSSPRTRVALVATRWGKYRPLEPLAGLVTNHGLEAVVAVSILASDHDEREGLPSIVMERP